MELQFICVRWKFFLNSQARAEEDKTVGVRNIKKQEQGVSVVQPIPV